MTPAPAEPPTAAVPCEQPSTQKDEGPAAVYCEVATTRRPATFMCPLAGLPA